MVRNMPWMKTATTSDSTRCTACKHALPQAVLNSYAKAALGNLYEALVKCYRDIYADFIKQNDAISNSGAAERMDEVVVLASIHEGHFRDLSTADVMHWELQQAEYKAGSHCATSEPLSSRITSHTDTACT